MGKFGISQGFQIPSDFYYYIKLKMFIRFEIRHIIKKKLNYANRQENTCQK